MTKPSPHSTTHPLDVVPLFRRWRPSLLRDLVYTAIWNAALATCVVMVSRFLNDRPTSFWQDMQSSLLISNLVGFLIHGSLMAGNRLLDGWLMRTGPVQRLSYLVLLVAVCAMLGISLGTALLRGVNPWHYLSDPASAVYLLRFGAVTAVFMFLIFMMGERRVARELLAARQREQVASAAQLVAEVRLRALQAQIEPHFLYNTLANVLGLIDTDPAQARRMLERFIDYLRASLAASRADVSTVGTELELAAAYLDVLAVRMGARLRYRIDADATCRALPIAPMLLQPVIENAVAHGLEPKVDGGEIVVSVARKGQALLIEVTDTGAGLRDTPPKAGGGVGLSNLRARMRSMYGAAGQVQLIENAPCGMTVRLILPLDS